MTAQHWLLAVVLVRQMCLARATSLRVCDHVSVLHWPCIACRCNHRVCPAADTCRFTPCSACHWTLPASFQSHLWRFLRIPHQPFFATCKTQGSRRAKIMQTSLAGPSCAAVQYDPCTLPSAIPCNHSKCTQPAPFAAPSCTTATHDLPLQFSVLLRVVASTPSHWILSAPPPTLETHNSSAPGRLTEAFLNFVILLSCPPAVLPSACLSPAVSRAFPPAFFPAF